MVRVERLVRLLSELRARRLGEDANLHHQVKTGCLSEPDVAKSAFGRGVRQASLQVFPLRTTNSFAGIDMMFQSGTHIFTHLELCILSCKCLWMLLMSLVYFVACTSI